MKTPLKQSFRQHLPLLLSFLLPLFAASLCFLLKGIEPFGDRLILYSDAYSQYFPFLAEFREKLLNGGSLEHTWSIGMGSSYTSLFAYYLSSPLYLLSVLVPESLLTEFASLLTILKLSLAGLAFGFFLRSAYRRNDLIIPFFALLYALCAWSSGYYWNIIWLDVFALLPLLTVGALSLLREGKFRLYVVSLTLCFWCNYYLSYCCCIFILLCFIGYNICRRCSLKNLLRRLGRFAICTLLAFGIAAALLLPTLLGMQNTASAKTAAFSLFSLNLPENNIPFAFSDFLQAISQVLSRPLPATTPTTLEGLPNLYCGFSAFLLAICSLCCKKLSRKERFFNIGLLIFFLLSCIFRALDYFWHGFHFPNMLPNRFSFLFSFVVLNMAYRAYTHLQDFRPRILLVLLPVGLLLIVNAYFNRDTTSFGHFGLLASVCILGGVCLFLLLRSRKAPLWRFSARHCRRIASILLCAMFLCEALLSFFLGVKAGTDAASYPLESESVQTLFSDLQDSEPFYRTEATVQQTSNDGALNGYNGISLFSSSANVNFTRFSRSLGLFAWADSNCTGYWESAPWTNTLCGVKYLIDRNAQQRNTRYHKLVASEGNCNLLYNEAYAGIGFMANSALADFVTVEDSALVFEEHQQLFTLATGVEDALYTYVKETPVLSASDGCSLETTDNDTQFLYTVGEGLDSGSFTLTYTMQESGLLYAAARMQRAKGMEIYRNGEKLLEESPAARGIFLVDKVCAGDEIQFVFTSKTYKKAGISLVLALHNDAVFDEGLQTLTDETWKLTEATDTRLSGTVEVLQDGLFYTSVPYEPGWTAYVDGEPVTIAQTYDPSATEIKLTDAVISFPLTAGTHTVTLVYQTPGRTLGLTVSLCSLAAFVALCVCLRKKSVFLPDLPKEAPHG